MKLKAQHQKVETIMLRYSEAEGRFVQRLPAKEPFLKGPIMLSNIKSAAELPGKSLQVYLAICWLSDMAMGQAIKVTKRAMEWFGFSADAYRDALLRLEATGLIEVTRAPGQKALIKLITMP